MKKTGQCPKCLSRKLGHLDYVTDRDEYPGTTRSLAVGLHKSRGLFSEVLDRDHAASPVEAWVCTACGYFEEHVRDPANVDWASLEHFTWVGDGQED